MGMMGDVAAMSGEMPADGMPACSGVKPPGPMAGDRVAYAHVIAYILRADPTYNFMRQDDQNEDDYVSPEDWKRGRYASAMISFQVEMWVNFVFLRMFYNFVLMKFQKEAEWLKQATGEETNASHPCRPLCCSSGSGTQK